MGSKRSSRQSKRTTAGRQLTTIDPITIAADGSLRVNAASVGAPPKTYDADFAWPEFRLGAVSLWFGKSDPNSDDGHLRTRLELRYAPEAFVAHFWQNSRGFHDGLRHARENLPGWEERGKVEPQNWKATNDHSEWVNFDSIARTGAQGVLDFFSLSPRAIVQFQRGMGSSQLILEPIVRINTTTLEILTLLDACEAIAERFAPLIEKIGSEKEPAEGKVQE